MASKSTKQGIARTTGKWKWTNEMVQSLLRNVKEYKSSMEFKGVDFEADLVVLYEEIRKLMALDFEGFGEVHVSECSKPLQDMNEKELKEFNDMVKLEKVQIKKGYDRVKEKIKTLRQDYRTAVNTGTWSGSGRIIRDNWEELTDIWAGSPATKPMKSGCSTKVINENSFGDLNDIEDEEMNENMAVEMELNISESVEFDDSQTSVNPNKRSSSTNATPKFVENKRKKLEKQLSAKQRDMILIDASKKEIELKTNIANGLLDSNKTINVAVSKMADSISALGAGLVQGFSVLAQAMSQNQQQPGFAMHNPGLNFQPVPQFPRNQYHFHDSRLGYANSAPATNPCSEDIQTD